MSSTRRNDPGPPAGRRQIAAGYAYAGESGAPAAKAIRQRRPCEHGTGTRYPAIDASPRRMRGRSGRRMFLRASDGRTAGTLAQLAGGWQLMPDHAEARHPGRNRAPRAAARGRMTAAPGQALRPHTLMTSRPGPPGRAPCLHWARKEAVTRS